MNLDKQWQKERRLANEEAAAIANGQTWETCSSQDSDNDFVHPGTQVISKASTESVTTPISVATGGSLRKKVIDVGLKKDREQRVTYQD